MSPVTYMVTGAGRGLGLEFVRQILAGDDQARVIASVRKLATAGGTADELVKLEHKYDGRFERLQMDQSDLASEEAAAEACAKLSFAKDGIDVLLANAGVSAGGFDGTFQPGAISYLTENLNVNVVGTAAVIEAFLPFLRKENQKRIWIVGSHVAAFSVEDFSSKVTGAACAASKAALHMWSVKLCRALAPSGFTVICFGPGWVQTDMGGPEAPMTAQECVSQSLAMLKARTPEDGGKLWAYDGTVGEW